MVQHSWWGWKFVLGIVGILLFLLLFLFPALTSLLLPQFGLPAFGGQMSLVWSERLLSSAMLLVAAVWVLFLGGTFASFLNVVAWRVPRGQSILGSSHCPHCNMRLGFKDNIPFWGWLKNWGSCSNCMAEIAPRYFIVEVVLALIFLLVVSLELVSGGMGLPIRTPDRMLAVTRMFFEPSGDLVAIVVLHLLLILALYTFVLVEIERHQIPASIFVFGLLFVVLLVMAAPAALVLPSGFPLLTSALPLNRIDAAMSLGIGSMIGAGFGILLEQQETGVGEGGPRTTSLRYGLALVGMSLGWQSAILSGCLWYVADLIIAKNATRWPWMQHVRCAPHATLLVMVLLYLSSWRMLNWLG